MIWILSLYVQARSEYWDQNTISITNYIRDPNRPFLPLVIRVQISIDNSGHDQKNYLCFKFLLFIIQRCNTKSQKVGVYVFWMSVGECKQETCLCV